MINDQKRLAAQRQRRAQRRQTRRPGRSGERGAALPVIAAEPVPAPVVPATVGQRLGERQSGALRPLAVTRSV